MAKHEIEKHRIVGVQQIASHCLVCGKDNPHSFHARFYNLEDGKIAVELLPTEVLQGFPDRLHGGVISTVMDELLNRAILVSRPEIVSVTMELSVKFRKPVPIGKPMRGIAWIEKLRTRTYDARGQIILEDGTIAAEAFGRFAMMRPEDVGGEEGVVYYFDDPRETPEFIEI